MKDPNANRTGYKRTRMGWIPADWQATALGDSVDTLTGYAFKSEEYSELDDGVLLLRGDNIDPGTISWEFAKRWDPTKLDGLDRYRLSEGDVVLAMDRPWIKGGIKVATVAEDDCPSFLVQRVARMRPADPETSVFFMAHILSKKFEYHIRSNQQEGGGVPHISSSQIKSFEIPLPTSGEIHQIAKVLSTWDEAITQTRDLIAAKQQQKKALMQQLLTGKKRLPGFGRTATRKEYRFFDLPADWKCPQVREVAKERSVRNGNDVERTVLSCSKHLGFVASADYFGKQVHSEDTSNYKVIRKGWLGYPSNHIEEGSIGLLHDHDEGVVSPIYTIFSTNSDVMPEYLYANFKTETYRHIFEVSTNASVDRRGSLRWDAFSIIRIPLPSRKEQEAIVDVLATADCEISGLQSKLAALQEQKKGLMQKLLTGQVRVKV